MYFLNFNDGFIEVPFASPSLNIYTVGCEHKCKGCHAKDLQDINHENRLVLTYDLLKKKLTAIPKFYKSVCWLGGDPFYQFDDCLEISRKLKSEFEYVYNVIYTGYNWKDFFENKILKGNYEYPHALPFDYIIDGTWNGKKLGEEGCNQKIWVHNPFYSCIFTYDEIDYNRYKKGLMKYE